MAKKPPSPRVQAAQDKAISTVANWVVPATLVASTTDNPAITAATMAATALAGGIHAGFSARRDKVAGDKAEASKSNLSQGQFGESNSNG